MAINGNSGDNVLRGTFLADEIFGFGGDDVIAGLGGNDTLSGGAGADRLDGGAGEDTANYSASAFRVLVDLDEGVGVDGDAAGDVLVNVENITGSSFNDLLIGNGGVNVLSGANGNDILEGLGGADTLNGGNGNDTAKYSSSPTGVIVDLSLNAGLGGDATNDTLISIENLTGSNFADTLFGDDFANVLQGGAGFDRLIGGRGVDTLRGGIGVDTFVWRDINESGNAIPTMDVIVDFDPLAGEIIDLSGIDADVFAGGNQAFTFIGSAAFSGTPGEVNFVHVGNETIIQLQTGVSGDIEMGIRIAGLVAPEASWFVL